ncbi:hypothetical protein TWF569_000300 [Orbilia oligospora]|uniref:Uncharacterized protein n=1 Tax=Orbilia oligospora TaxID=2813651 RepID=A0A7C8J524_ORBOL|nr:hypothetical protein TWF102_007291 [Orbilia oligospora]KAF3099275.1 hypothetical protein TWF103_008788 [Orbilia oligospora]KAF3116328.1 hypothetical protein TWF706_003976 [Orbilia oligospora]KAF3133530.1 hypothetical protein TWF594_008999 [Orbilia oligospora]KAF3154323.1 hypothetical protein TWF569_000300 [Orbilia oligospora]
MATLTNLPYDIKHCILRQVDERGTLLTLISTSRAFYNIFTRHKEGILHNLYLSEALSYSPDSIVFTYCRQKVPTIDDFTTLSEILQGYQLVGQRGLPTSFLESKNGEYNPRRQAHQLVNDYLGIRKIALAHQYAVRAARREPDLTASELHRITQAIYRGWSLLLLLNKGLDLELGLRVASSHSQIDMVEPGGEADCFDIQIEKLIATWDIWDVLRIQSVMGESIRILPTGQVNMNDSGAFNQFEADIEKSGLRDIVERCSQDEKVVLVFPIYSMVDSYPSTTASFALSTEFAQYLLIHHDPTAIAALYTLFPTPDAKTVYDRMAKHLASAVEGYLLYKASRKGIYTHTSLDTLQYTITRMLGWYSPVIDGVGFGGMEVRSMRLVNKVSWMRGKIFGKEAKRVGAHSWIQWARLSGCVYDDARLEGRGLEWPVFEG